MIRNAAAKPMVAGHRFTMQRLLEFIEETTKYFETLNSGK